VSSNGIVVMIAATGVALLALAYRQAAAQLLVGGLASMCG
jgi:hypothetical protein